MSEEAATTEDTKEPPTAEQGEEGQEEGGEKQLSKSQLKKLAKGKVSVMMKVVQYCILIWISIRW
jgi:hypothetical protein